MNEEFLRSRKRKLNYKPSVGVCWELSQLRIYGRQDIFGEIFAMRVSDNFNSLTRLSSKIAEKIFKGLFLFPHPPIKEYYLITILLAIRISAAKFVTKIATSKFISYLEISLSQHHLYSRIISAKVRLCKNDVFGKLKIVY